MPNPFRAERLDPKDGDPRRGDTPGDMEEVPALDPRAVQRTFNTFRDRLRMQEDELDHLRAMIRSVHNLSAADQVGQLAGRVERMESRLPESFDAAVGVKLEKLETQLRQLIAEGQGTILDTATENVSSRVLPRMIAVEAEMLELRGTAQQIREVMKRTDANLSKLVSEVDRLVTEIAKRPERTIAAEDEAGGESAEYPEIPVFETADPEPGRWKVPAFVLGVLVVLALGGWLLFTQAGISNHGGGTRSDAASTLSPIEQARVFESKKDYPRAEAIYRELLKKDPDNGEVIRHLASVLFRQDKWDESAAILKKLSGGDNTNQ